jgi:hypothetical protein
MTCDLPAVLARLIPRLGSPFDHEVVATARAIERTLGAQKLDWHDVAVALPALAPPPRGTREGAPLWCYLDSEESLQWLAALASEPVLNHWSRSFVNSITAQIRSGCRLSPKQLACVDKILAAAWRRGVRPDARQRA